MLVDHFCTDWNDFLKILNEYFLTSQNLEKQRYLFRGQANSAWQLTSVLDRRFNSLDKDEKSKIEERLLSDFKATLEDHVQYSEVVKDSHQLSALAQHHGLPTRLIDWTENPFIAAFFAFQDYLWNAFKSEEEIENVAIYVIDRTFRNVWNDKVGVQVFSPRKVENIRLKNQMGWFTIANVPFDSLEEYVEKASQNIPGALHKMHIPKLAAKDALQYLDIIGISSELLFPGVDGIATTALFRSLL